MKTILHYYCFDTNNKKEHEQYSKLWNELSQTRKCFSAWGGNDFKFYKDHIEPLDGKEIKLETNFIFTNQWNTAPTETSKIGLRVFDWTQMFTTNDYFKKGYYLDITPEMTEIRQKTYVCGFCGKQYNLPKTKFCLNCLKSQYLKDSELHLLRLRPVSESDSPFPPLSKEEKDYLLPLYEEAQKETAKKLLEERIFNIKKKAKEKIENAETEGNAILWLIEHGLTASDIENCIYYNHTKTFCFGWKNKLNDTEKSRLTSILDKEGDNFPYPYKFKKE